MVRFYSLWVNYGDCLGSRSFFLVVYAGIIFGVMSVKIQVGNSLRYCPVFKTKNKTFGLIISVLVFPTCFNGD